MATRRCGHEQRAAVVHSSHLANGAGVGAGEGEGQGQDWGQGQGPGRGIPRTWGRLTTEESRSKMALSPATLPLSASWNA